MERKLDSVDAYQQGLQEGMRIVFQYVNKFCDTNINSIADLILAVKTLQEGYNND